MPSDDGGHYVAARFNDPKEAFNHFAQDQTVNRGKYRLLEDQWARAKKAGARVRIKITPAYAMSSRRPSNLNILFWTDGLGQSVVFPNRSEGAKHAKR